MQCAMNIYHDMYFLQYEFKVKGIRKVRCYLQVSVDGAKVTKRKSKRVTVCVTYTGQPSHLINWHSSKWDLYTLTEN